VEDSIGGSFFEIHSFQILNVSSFGKSETHYNPCTSPKLTHNRGTLAFLTAGLFQRALKMRSAFAVTLFKSTNSFTGGSH
jgi:hypothetical protein